MPKTESEPPSVWFNDAMDVSVAFNRSITSSTKNLYIMTMVFKVKKAYVVNKVDYYEFLHCVTFTYLICHQENMKTLMLIPLILKTPWLTALHPYRP